MSKATVVLRDRRPAEAGAQWWRMAFNTTELVEMVADHPDEPPVMRWTFPDGLDETSRRAQCVTGNRAHACLQVESRTGPDTEPRAVSVHCRRSSAYSWPGGRPTHRDGWN